MTVTFQLRTIRCASCDATFPSNGASAVSLPHLCPRCGQHFFTRGRTGLTHAQPELSAIDLQISSFCSICGCILSARERVGIEPTCHYPGCVHRRAERDLAARRERERAVQVEKIERKTRDLDISLDPYPEIAILPANTRKLVPMAPERRTEFAARLKAIVDEIENAKGDGARGGVQSADVGPPHRELVGLACATCRGYCCRAGGNEAYMTPAVFRRVLAQSPDLTPADLQRAYLSRIPQESYEESCIFHSRTGCTLPRDRRADICNNFLCSGVRDLPADPDAQRLAAAIGATGIVRLALIGGDGNSLLFEEE